MNKWNFAFILIILFWSIALVDTQAYTHAWIDGSPELNEQARFLNQVLGQDVGARLAPAAVDVVEPVHKLGDKRDFYAVKMGNNDQYELEASVRAISDRSYIFVETGRSVATSKIINVKLMPNKLTKVKNLCLNSTFIDNLIYFFIIDHSFVYMTIVILSRVEG